MNLEAPQVAKYLTGTLRSAGAKDLLRNLHYKHLAALRPGHGCAPNMRTINSFNQSSFAQLLAESRTIHTCPPIAPSNTSSLQYKAQAPKAPAMLRADQFPNVTVKKTKEPTHIQINMGKKSRNLPISTWTSPKTKLFVADIIKQYRSGND